MLKYLKAPWIISLIISILTIVWVKWELSCRQASVRPVEEQTEAQAEEQEEADNAGPKQSTSDDPSPAQPPNLQPRDPIPWEAGLPPPMPFPKGFTQVTEVDQPLDLEDGAFEQTE